MEKVEMEADMFFFLSTVGWLVSSILVVSSWFILKQEAVSSRTSGLLQIKSLCKMIHFFIVTLKKIDNQNPTEIFVKDCLSFGG
jgi:hypothetical protein